VAVAVQLLQQWQAPPWLLPGHLGSCLHNVELLLLLLLLQIGTAVVNLHRSPAYLERIETCRFTFAALWHKMCAQNKLL
jgi:hypothetical protein